MSKNKTKESKESKIIEEKVTVGRPPFQLLSYFFPNFSYKASKNFLYDTFQKQSIDEISKMYDTVEVKSALASPKGGDKTTEVILQVEIYTINYVDEKQTNPLPYDFYLEVIGFFKFEKEIQREKRASIIMTNGVGTLYSVAREFLTFVTSRGPFIPIKLPLRSFVPIKVLKNLQPVSEGPKD